MVAGRSLSTSFVSALCGIMAKYRYPEIPSVQALPILLNGLSPILSLAFLLGMWVPVISAGSPFLMGATTKGWD